MIFFLVATRAVDYRNILALWITLSLAAIILAVTTIFFVRLMRRKERMEALYGVARLDFRRPGDLAKSVVSKNERSVLASDRRLEHVIDESNAARLPRYTYVPIKIMRTWYMLRISIQLHLHNLTMRWRNVQILFRASLWRSAIVITVDNETIAELFRNQVFLQELATRTRHVG